MADILYFIDSSKPVKTSAVCLANNKITSVQYQTDSLVSVSGLNAVYDDRFKSTSGTSGSSSNNFATLYATALGYSIASGIEYNNGFRSGNYTLNWNNSNLQSLTLSGNTVLTLSGATEGSRLQLLVKQDSVGSRTVTWPGTVKWSMGGTPPTLTTTANGIDMICMYYKDNVYYSTSATTFL